MVQQTACGCKHHQLIHERYCRKGWLGGARKEYTNHSTHKTLVKKLKKTGVDGRNIAAILGHKTEESLRDYDENDLKIIVD